MGLPVFRGIGFRIPLRGLSGYRVPLGLLVPAHLLLVPVSRYFEFSMSFFDALTYLGLIALWYHIGWCSVTTRYVFLSLFLEYVEMVLSDYNSYLINSHVCCSRSFLFRNLIENSVCVCVVRLQQCWWLLVAHLCWVCLHGCHFLSVFEQTPWFCFRGWCHYIHHYAAFYIQ